VRWGKDGAASLISELSSGGQRRPEIEKENDGWNLTDMWAKWGRNVPARTDRPKREPNLGHKCVERGPAVRLFG
jgi:hypothetical protein